MTAKSVIKDIPSGCPLSSKVRGMQPGAKERAERETV